MFDMNVCMFGRNALILVVSCYSPYFAVSNTITTTLIITANGINLQKLRLVGKGRERENKRFVTVFCIKSKVDI